MSLELLDCLTRRLEWKVDSQFVSAKHLNVWGKFSNSLSGPSYSQLRLYCSKRKEETTLRGMGVRIWDFVISLAVAKNQIIALM